MKNKEKSEEQLIEELAKLRKQNAKLRKSYDESKKKEKALRESKEMYKTLLETSTDSIVVHKLDGEMIEVSQQMVKQHGVNNEKEILGKSGFEFIAPEDQEKAKIYYMKLMKEGLLRNVEFTFQRKNGTRFIGEINATLIKDIYGKPKGFIGSTKDITKQKKAEEALQESEEMYRSVVETSSDLVVIMDLNGKIIDISKGTIERLGFESANDMIGKNGFMFVAPENREKARMIQQKIFNEGFVRNVEFTMLKKNGIRYYAECNAFLLKDAYAKPKAIISTTRDITQRKKAEEALRESEKMYRTLVNTSVDSIVVTDMKGKVLEISQGTLELLKLEDANELIGKNGFSVFAPENLEKAKAMFQKLMKQGFLENIEFIYIRKDGTRFIGESNANLIRDAHGKPKVIISSTRDITDRKRAEEVLRKSEKKLKQEVKILRSKIQKSRRYPEIIGNSPKIIQLIDLVNQVARIDSTVLILGETGSGKDLIAKAIHFNSPRKEGPFLVLNCAALPEQLIESELFGYVKGAFTGANHNKKGLFEAAEKGSIFLNEIGEMPFNLQAKLLHVLENQEIRRIGESKNITVDARIIVATNKDLQKAVQEGSFREDLFYRLNVFPIKIPPLRERKDDIPMLVKHFLDKYCFIMNKQISKISQKAMDILCSYHYPGNVRELENLIQRSILMAQGAILLPHHLPEELSKIKYAAKPRNLAESLDETERHTIEAALKECKGHLTRAARKLGISRTSLWRRINKFDIDVSHYVS